MPKCSGAHAKPIPRKLPNSIGTVVAIRAETVVANNIRPPMRNDREAIRMGTRNPMPVTMNLGACARRPSLRTPAAASINTVPTHHRGCENPNAPDMSPAC
jgi:hypothetical protein